MDFNSRSATRYRCLALRGGLIDSSGGDKGSASSGGGGNGGGNGTRPDGGRDGEGSDRWGRGGGGSMSSSWLDNDSTQSVDASLAICDSTAVAMDRPHH